MKKSERKRVDKILNKNKIVLSYDSYKQNVYINNIKYTNKEIKKQSWFSLIKGTLNMNNDEDVLREIIEIANERIFNSNEQKEKKKEQEKIEYEKKKEQEKIEYEKKKEQEKIEYEKKQKELENFIKNFDYSILEKLPKNTWVNSIKLILDKNGFDTKPIVYQRILNQYILRKSTKDKEKYEKLGYILNEDDKIDDSNPVNYEVFFDNFFYKKEEWEALDKTKQYDRKYCFYDEWQDTYNIIENDKNITITPEKIRTLVRQYAPIKNVYVVNDMYKDWIKNNRNDCALLNEIKSYAWDGVDRLGINKESNSINENENILCKCLKVDQTPLNKKMFAYALLHSMRQIIWPCRYNFQHILSLIGDTNCGKTKTLQDLFTFKCGKFYCGNLDLEKDAEWTIGEKMSRCVAVLWNEKKGINKSANEVIKNFIDLVNDGFSYQKKHEQATTQYISHNICFITYNPKQSPLLSDYSVSYEKRYYIAECKQNEQGFLKYLHYIEKEHDQIWAQLYDWCINNQDAVLELDENDLNELKIIQSRNKGIDTKDIEDALHYQLNVNKYITDKLIDGEQIKNSKDIRLKDKAIYQANFISNAAFKALLSQISMDSRHISLINEYNIMKKIGWIESKPKTIDGHTYRGYMRLDSSENQYLFE